MYLVLTIIPDIYLRIRGEALGPSGLHYIAFCIGACSTAYFNMHFLDQLYRYLKKRNDGVGEPEFRLRMVLVPVSKIIIY